MQIKILDKQGKSLRTIACELGCAVNTVRNYLNGEAPPAYQERVHREPKVGQIKEVKPGSYLETLVSIRDNSLLRRLKLSDAQIRAAKLRLHPLAFKG